MSWRGAGVVSALVLAGCATPAPPDLPPPGDNLSGRLSVQVEATEDAAARNLSAAFELFGTPSRGRLDLNTPIGSTLVRARWEPAAAYLDTPQGSTRHETLAELSRAALGEELPISALFDWLQGRPWPGAQSSASGPTEPAGFRQLGWSVDLSRFETDRIAARRERAPVVIVQIRLDRP